tara:strand:+ start:789 stop:1793 length:1005 start_codon:yes stop_codon:yes gene_type:complete
MKIAILGAGAWGTALAINLSKNSNSRHEIVLWTKDSNHCDDLIQERVNREFLPNFLIPDSIKITSDLNFVVKADLALIVIPTVGLRETLRAIISCGKAIPIIWGGKGFEAGSAKLPNQIAQEEYEGVAPYGVLSGPSFAHEVAKGLPVALTLASRNNKFSKYIAAEIHNSRFRVYSSSDIIGVETCGAIKNVITIAAGISDGMGLGSNARAALITRGLAEISRLGVKLGGKIETFMGLTGVGDLILTCTGDLSRNRKVGLSLAAGKSLKDTLKELGHVAEGVYTARSVLKLSQELGVDMPITQAVCSILDNKIPAKEALEILLNREQKTESLIF